MYNSVYCIVYSVYCIVYSVYCIVYSVYCLRMVYSIQYTVPTVYYVDSYLKSLFLKVKCKTGNLKSEEHWWSLAE